MRKKGDAKGTTSIETILFNDCCKLMLIVSPCSKEFWEKKLHACKVQLKRVCATWKVYFGVLNLNMKCETMDAEREESKRV